MKKKMYVAMLCLCCLLVMTVYAAKKGAKSKETSEEPTVSKEQGNESKENLLKTEMDKVSYAIGTQIGNSFKQGGIDIKVGLLVRGLNDVMKDKELLLSQGEMQQIMMAFQMRMQAEQQKKMAEQQELNKIEAPKNLAKGAAYLAANKKKKGVKELPSGLQYKIIKKGKGQTPTADSVVKTHYRGTLIDGTEFDSSYKSNQPVEFPVKGVIAGWTEALQLMKEGAKWELYIPANLAYGERVTPSIPANSTLIFEIELIEIVK